MYECSVTIETDKWLEEHLVRRVGVMLDIAVPSLVAGKEPLHTPPAGANCTPDLLSDGQSIQLIDAHPIKSFTRCKFIFASSPHYAVLRGGL